MKTRCIVHEETFSVSPEELFDTLIRPSAIRSWWSVATAIVLPREGGYWAATWGEKEDEPDYVSFARIKAFDPPRLLQLGDYEYGIPEALGFDADFSTKFEVIPSADGATLRVENDGFPSAPEADDFHAACVQGWEDTFAGIRRHLEAVS